MGEIFESKKHAAGYWLMFPLMVMLIPFVGWILAAVFLPLMLVAWLMGGFKQGRNS